MPLITLSPYRRNYGLSSFDMNNFVKVVQNVNQVNSTGDAFYQLNTGNVLLKATDATQGFTRINATSPTLPSGNYGTMAKSPTSGRIFMIPTNDSNNSYSGLYYSDDGGVNWALRSLPLNLRWAFGGIACGNGVVIASTLYSSGTTVGGTVRSLDDGITWTNITSKTGATGFTGLIYVQRLNMWLGTIGSTVRRSTDNGETWTPVSVGSPATTKIIDIGDKLVTWSNATATNPFHISTDGINWSVPAYDTGETTILRDAAYGAGLFVVNHNSTNRLYTTTDFVNWSVGSFPTPTPTVGTIKFANNQFVVAMGTSYYWVYQT